MKLSSVLRTPPLYLATCCVLCSAVPGKADPYPEPLDDARYPIVMDDWPVLINEHHQFFIDDELIADKQGVVRTVVTARKHPDNPVLRPEHGWEDDMVLLYGSVIREEDTGQFRMWYLGRNFEDKNPMRTVVCYAESDDGVNWVKPELGLFDYKGSRDNNIVAINHGQGFDTLTVFKDPAAKNESDRYKLFIYHYITPEQREGVYLQTSADGIHWSDEWESPVLIGTGEWIKNADSQFRDDVKMDGVGDVTFIRYDEVLKKYVANLKILRGPMRSRMLAESDDLIHWTTPRLILEPDARDAGTQFYGMVDFPYESIWLGVLQRYMAATDLRLDLTWAVSYDGRNWSRVEPRDPFVPCGESNTWDYGNLSPANNPPIRVGDELWFYYGGRDATHNTRPDIGAIGLAILPIDRFVALSASQQGTVLTRPLNFEKGTIHINADASAGSIRVAAIGVDGKPLPGYDLKALSPIGEDGLDIALSWDGVDSLEAVDEPVRLLFELNHASLYSFWIEPGE